MEICGKMQAYLNINEGRVQPNRQDRPKLFPSLKQSIPFS